MAIEAQLEGMQKIIVRYANSPVRNIAEENFEDLDDELDEFALAEVLQDQESLYQSILDDAQSDQTTGARTNATSHYSHGQSSSGATTSQPSDIDAQIAFDEALARQLQEMEDLSIDTPPNEHTDGSCIESLSETGESSNGNNEEGADRQDDVDPDHMTYEERQALGESVGTENRGLSDELISYLESSKYKSGFFSRKAEHEECVICQSTYRKRERLITLPCKHYFHKACIAEWLKINRICPVCKYEVFGPS